MRNQHSFVEIIFEQDKIHNLISPIERAYLKWTQYNLEPQMK